MHSHVTSEAKRAYFDQLALRWDGFGDPKSLRLRLAAAVADFKLQRNEVIVDLGCGTGVLTSVLLQMLVPEAHIYAVDFSSQMIEIAKTKVHDSRVEWIVTDAATLPIADNSADRVICFASWPHFMNDGLVAKEIWRTLKPGGILNILHLESRERIAEIHAHAGEAVHGDVLPAVEQLAALLADTGLVTFQSIEASTMYLLSARKTAHHA